MRSCSKCGESYEDRYRFCPVDGVELEAAVETFQPFPYHSPRNDSEPAVVTVRTLVLSLGLLVLVAFLSAAAAFFYLSLKPKYGGLVVKTTPAGATIFVDGKSKGSSPLTVEELRSGGYQIKAVKEGYKERIQQVEVIPYATENLHWKLEPLIAKLSNEQLAEVESWRKKLETAQKENILLPPPDDYNVLYFANKILAIDPANPHAQEVKGKLAEGLRRSADVSYAREDWLEAEKHYKQLAAILPDDISINERLTDLAAKIDASVKDREKQVAEWTAKAEAAVKAGSLVPPEKDNALDAIRNIERLDKKNVYAKGALLRVKELLQNRGDTKISSADWQGARNDFKLVLQYFPEDNYSKSRLEVAEAKAKLAEIALKEQQGLLRKQEEQQLGQTVSSLRQSAINFYRSGAYDKAIAEWREFLKFDANSDEAYYYLGAAHMEQKQLDTAILNFEKAVSLNPNHGMAHVNLGLLYDRHRNDIASAVDHFRKAEKLGGVDKYTPDRLQAMVQDLQQRSRLASLENTPFAVEHKHAFSSCKGNLLITEQGVEYKTTENDHSFYEAYASLRNLGVQGDDIAIRTRNNKKYNFRLVNPRDGNIVRSLASRHIQLTADN
jgi:tetratricopeptide (TPR) repeat protein